MDAPPSLCAVVRCARTGRGGCSATSHVLHELLMCPQISGDRAEGRTRSHLVRTIGGMSERLLTAGEVAETLRVSTMTVYRLIRRGELPAVRVGRNYRVRVSDLDRYLEQQAVDPVSVDLDQLEEG